jgi:hypothetical protein
MAGYRYFLGETYRMEYEKSKEIKPAIKAMTHFYNVYFKYGDSEWGSRALIKAEAAKAFVESKGKRVELDLTKNCNQFVTKQLEFSESLFFQRRYTESISRYLMVINWFPRIGKIPIALQNIGISYAQLEQKESAQMVVEYLCEQFATNTFSAGAVLAIGRQFLASNPVIAENIFNQY